VTNSAATPVALCADDYAMSEAVDSGIRRLADAGRLTAVSCLTVSPRWRLSAVAISGFSGAVDIGLHFSLTEFSPLGSMRRLAPGGSLPALRELLPSALCGRLDRAEVSAEFARQYDAFCHAFGRPPRFVDGHHHVHQLPVVRDAIAEFLADAAPQAWVRNTATTAGRLVARPAAMGRTAFLARLGVVGRRRWRAARLATNADFAGIRSFRERQPYRLLFRRFVAGARPGLLVMSHPGEADAMASDSAVRAGELAYLSGPHFADDMAAAGCRLARLSDHAGR